MFLFSNRLSSYSLNEIILRISRATTLEKWHDLLTQYIIPHDLQNFQQPARIQMKMENKRTGYLDPWSVLGVCVCTYIHT